MYRGPTSWICPSTFFNRSLLHALIALPTNVIFKVSKFNVLDILTGLHGKPEWFIYVLVYVERRKKPLFIRP